MKRLRASSRRHLIVIKRPQQVSDGKGGYTSALVPVASCWAEVRAESGRERVIDEVLQGISVYRIRILWRGDIQTSDQIEYAGQALNIRSADDPDGKRRELFIIADTASTRTS